ncbi:hypothetical protein LM602_06690 [Candidatus Acetothermia bacterium]|jgi:hypothetical protein|nr:hypothetical protein [Candidatus Acetothermia bacterium]MCI2432221.1 hypothetical protein [Candidatus Acetothermia bacterium]MCI2436124.1 hypothetical protein [Candidatus Acetothermia bacterium]
MNKIAVLAPNGGRASPYRVEGGALVKKVTERHIYRLRQAVGIDEAVWQEHRDGVGVVRFEFPDGSVREIEAHEFERRSFLHGDGARFAVTRFIVLADLTLAKDGMRALFAFN